MKRDDFVLMPGKLKREKAFIKSLLKLCEKYQMVFYARGIHQPHNRIRIYDRELQDMREYLE